MICRLPLRNGVSDAHSDGGCRPCPFQFAQVIESQGVADNEKKQVQGNASGYPCPPLYLGALHDAPRRLPQGERVYLPAFHLSLWAGPCLRVADSPNGPCDRIFDTGHYAFRVLPSEGEFRGACLCMEPGFSGGVHGRDDSDIFRPHGQN